MKSITKPGAEIHNYQPTPGDILRAQDAELVLWNGFNLELWFERFLRNLSDVPSVVVSEGVRPIGIQEGPYTGKPNPHAWMSPSNALIYVDNIRDALLNTIPKTPKRIAQHRRLQPDPGRRLTDPAPARDDPRRAPLARDQ